jgi:hypothetical protein
MEHTKQVVLEDQEVGVYQDTRNIILVEDTLKQLRPAIRDYAVTIKNHIREGMYRGFDRTLVRYSLRMCAVEIGSFIAIAEDALAATNGRYSSQVGILKSELEALKKSIEIFIRTIEETVLEEPDIEKQMFFDNSSRRK